MRHDERDDYQAWLWSTVLLIGLLGAALALFVAYPGLRNTYELPQARLVLDTAVMLAAAIVARARRDPLLGRRAAARPAALRRVQRRGGLDARFTIAPGARRRSRLRRTEAWAGAGGRLFAWLLIAAAPFSTRRSSARGRALGEMLLGVAIVLALSWGIAAKAGRLAAAHSPAIARTTSRCC